MLSLTRKRLPVGIKDVYRGRAVLEQNSPLSQKIILLREDSFSGKAVNFGWVTVLSYDVCLEPCVEKF